MSDRRRLSHLDVLLALMVIVWAINYSVLKRAFEELPPIVFNAMRMSLASVLFLIGIAVVRHTARARPRVDRTVFYTPQPVTRRDWWQLAGLGLVGHLAYQTAFAAGLAQTSASNGALIIGATPVMVALGSGLLGRERLGRGHWIGLALSMIGIYFVVARGAATAGHSWRGDALLVFAACCWAAYTIGGSAVMRRHSPLYVTGISLAIGTLPYALLAVPSARAVHWDQISATVWLLLIPAGLLSVNFAYLVWYAAVLSLGPARTSIYSNVIPIAGMLFAALWLGDPITLPKLMGAGAILGGVVLTRQKR